jgi:hypothetical protein
VDGSARRLSVAPLAMKVARELGGRVVRLRCMCVVLGVQASQPEACRCRSEGCEGWLHRRLLLLATCRLAKSMSDQHSVPYARKQGYTHQGHDREWWIPRATEPFVLLQECCTLHGYIEGPVSIHAYWWAVHHSSAANLATSLQLPGSVQDVRVNAEPRLNVPKLWPLALASTLC